MYVYEPPQQSFNEMGIKGNAVNFLRENSGKFNILAYIEPIVQLDWPTWFLPWCGFAHSVVFALKKSGMLKNSMVLTNKYLNKNAKEIFNNTNSKVVTIEQDDLLKPFGDDYLRTTSAFYDGSYNEDQIKHVIKSMSKRIGDFKPDVILTFSPVPFLQKIFPEALILHMEVDAFSRPPYGLSCYLDPFGMYKYGALAKLRDGIDRYKPSKEEVLAVDLLRARALKELGKRGVEAKDIAIEWYRQFENIILLPLHLSGYYAFDANCNFKSQLECLDYVMMHTPLNIGVVITQHPQHACIDRNREGELKEKYKNIIFHDAFLYGVNASQFILPYIDGVVTVSSTVGLQAVLFGKKLFVLGKSHLTSLADAQNLKNMTSVLKSSTVDKSNWLAWLFGRYYINHAELTNPEYLLNYISLALEYKKANRLGEFFFDCFDRNDAVNSISKFTDEINSAREIPYNKVLSTKEFRTWAMGVELKKNEGGK